MRRFIGVGSGWTRDRLLAWVAIVLAVGSTMACSRDEPLLEAVPRGGAGVTANATVSERFTLTDLTCLERPERVVLDGLDAHVVGGAEVTRTAVRVPQHGTIGFAPNALPTGFEDVEGFVVEGLSCADKSWVELAIEVAPDTRASSAIDGMTLRYRVGDRHYEATLGMSMVLCVGHDTGNGQEILADCGEEEYVPNTSPPPTTTF